MSAIEMSSENSDPPSQQGIMFHFTDDDEMASTFIAPAPVRQLSQDVVKASATVLAAASSPAPGLAGAFQPPVAAGEHKVRLLV